MFRHEGKLTGLAAYGEPKLADAMAGCFRFNTQSGLIESDFRHWTNMEAAMQAICQGQNRQTIAASIQKGFHCTMMSAWASNHALRLPDW